jgi:Transglutaminase-like superfamily
VDPFLRRTDVLDFDHPRVAALARELSAADSTSTARRMFEWVRDHIAHTGDAGRDEVTCTASQVLETGTGFCYAKSHLLGRSQAPRTSVPSSGCGCPTERRDLATVGRRDRQRPTSVRHYT